MLTLQATSNSLWAIALAEGYPAIVKLLLRAGANPEKSPDLNRDFKLDNKMAMVLCSIDDNGRLQVSLVYPVITLCDYITTSRHVTLYIIL